MGTRRGVHGTPGDSIDTLYYHHTTSLPASPERPRSISHHAPGGNIHQAPVSKELSKVIASPRQARRKRPLPPSPEPELNPSASNPQARSKPRLMSSPRSKTQQKRDTGAQTPKAKSSSSRLTSGNTDEHMEARNFNDLTAAESSPLRRGMRLRRKRALDMEDDDEVEDDLCNGQGVEGVRGSVGGQKGLVEGQQKESIQPRRKRLGQNTEAALLVAVAQHGEEHRVTKAMGEDLDDAVDPSSLFSRLKIPRSLRTGVTRGRSMVPPAQVPSLWAPSSSQQTPSGGGSKEGKASPRGETSKGEGSQGYAGPLFGAPQGAPSPLQQQEHLKQVLAEVAGRCVTSRSASSSPKPSSLHALLTAASLASPLGPQTPQKPISFSQTPDILSPIAMAAHPAHTQTNTPLLSPEDINRQLALARELKTHIGLNHRFSLNSDMTRRISASIASQPGPQQAMLPQALALPTIPSTAATTTTSSAAAESANAPELDAGSSGPSEDAEPTTGSVSPRAIDQTNVPKTTPARTVQTAPPNTPAHYVNSLAARQSHAGRQLVDGGNALDRVDSLDRGNMSGHMNGVASAREELLAAVGELRMNGALMSFNSSPLPASSSRLQEPERQFELTRAASALPQPVATSPGMLNAGLEGMLSVLDKKVKEEDMKSEGARKSDSGSAIRLTDECRNATPGAKAANMEVEAVAEGPRSSRRGGGRASRTKVNEGMEGACQHPHCKHGIWSTEPLKPYCFTHMKERGLCEVLGCKKWSRATSDGGHLYCNQHMDLAYGAQPQQLQRGTRGILIKDGSSKIQQSPKPRSTPSPTPSSSHQPLSTTHSAATTPARTQPRQTPPNPHTPQPPTATTPSSHQNPVKLAPDSPAASPAPTTLPPATLFSSPPSHLHLPSDDPVPTPDAPRKRARTKPRTPVAIRRLPSLTEEHPLATPTQTPFKAGPPDPRYQPSNDFTPHPQLTPAPPTPVPTAPAPSTKPSTKRRTATRSLPVQSPDADESPASVPEPTIGSTPASGKRRKLLSPKSSPTHPTAPNATHMHESTMPTAAGIAKLAHPTASMNGVANGLSHTPARAHASAAARGAPSSHGKARTALFHNAPSIAALSPVGATNGAALSPMGATNGAFRGDGALRSDDAFHGSSELAGGGTGSTIAGGTASAAGSSMMEEEDGPQLLLHLATAAAAAARQQDDEDDEEIEDDAAGLKDDAAVLGRLWEKRGSSNGRDRGRSWGRSDVNSEAQGEFEGAGTSRFGSVAVTPVVTPLPTPGSIAGTGKLIGLVEGGKAKSAGFKPHAEGKRDWIKSGKQVRGQFEGGGTDALKVGGAGHANLFDLAAAAVTQYLSSVNSTRGNDRPPR